MLAGNVKLKNFLLALALAGGGAAVFVAVGMAWMVRNGPAPTPTPDPIMVAEVAPSSGGATPSVPAGSAMTEAVQDVLAHRNDALPVDKVKDISPGKPWKINLYQDPGHKTVNRAKLDLDRDEKWDEKFSFDLDGTVTREIAPNDDEQYATRLTFSGDHWTPEGGAASTAAPDAPATAPTATVAPGELAARPVDTTLMTYKGKNLGTDKLKDVTKGQPYKLNVYQEAGEASANRAKIDLDRDDKWDEKITFKGNEITREVAPADDEAYTETWLWTGAGWKKK